MDDNDIRIVQQMVETGMKKVATYQVRKLGDTPTDSYQLTPKSYVDHRVTGGFVIAGGTAGVPFPVGWTVAKTATGIVTVTRAVDPYVLAKYSVVATPLSASAIFATINNHVSTSFDINTFNVAGVAVDASVYFVVSAVY